MYYLLNIVFFKYYILKIYLFYLYIYIYMYIYIYISTLTEQKSTFFLVTLMMKCTLKGQNFGIFSVGHPFLGMLKVIGPTFGIQQRKQTKSLQFLGRFYYDFPFLFIC